MQKKREGFLQKIKDKGLNARTLAKELELSHERVYKWIYGKATPSVLVMLRLMEVLDISAEEVLNLFKD